MLRGLYSCACLLISLSVLTGCLYPLLITVFAQAVFPQQANGSLVIENGRVLGSSLIGQAFSRSEYFWPRPSAAGYNGAASTGSNLSPTNPAHLEAVAEQLQQLRSDSKTPVPVDLVTTSASGLDPHITPAGALFQAPRIAQARGLPEATLRELVAAKTQERTFGLFGERRVNVLELNRALDDFQTVK